jgi:hypothetical protein
MKAIRIGLIAALLGASAFSGCSGCGPVVNPPVVDDGGNTDPDGGENDGGSDPNDGGGNPDPDGGSPDGGGPDAGLIPTDPGNTNNAVLDSDCDGLSDQEEFGTLYAGNKRTLPGNPDTDGDGLKDGFELGRTSSPNAACGFVGDSDTASKTVPTEADSDQDGLSDGVEDANKNGKYDAPAETDPRVSDTDGDGLQDGAEDADKDAVVDASETDPRKRDTDGDNISDGTEVNVTGTNPIKADTDGDTCNDGAEDFNQDGSVQAGETNPKVGTDCGQANVPDTDLDGIPNSVETATGTNPAVADSDQDGLNDGVEDKNKNGQVDTGETNPRRRDSDCDALIDGPTNGAVRGEDLDASGAVNGAETDPTKNDTDGDGITDGVELGVTANPDATNCPGARLSGTPASNTNPNSKDSDSDGIEDGAEDLNQNGTVDNGELNPKAGDATGPAGQVCTATNLRPVLFKVEGAPDLQLGLPSTFTDVRPLTVGTAVRGMIGHDSVNKVTFIAWREANRGGATDPTADEAALRAVINGVGALTNPLTQTFTTWDNIPALQAFYDQVGTGVDLNARASVLANALVGTTGAPLPTTAGVNGPFKIQLQVAHRSNTSVVNVLALVPSAGFVEPAIFYAGDVAGGSALAQFGDANAQQCEKFTAGTSKVDFLFVVDDSCSMASAQTSLGQAGAAMEASLNNSTLDWRVGMVTTDTSRPLRPFTKNANQFKAWLAGPPNQPPPASQDYTGYRECRANPGAANALQCATNDPSGNTLNRQFIAGSSCPSAGDPSDACWIRTDGTGTEVMLRAARAGVNTVTPAPAVEVADKIRPGAVLVVVGLGDADDQSNEAIADYIAFFNNTGAAAGTTRNNANQRIVFHGIVCPPGADCPVPVAGSNPPRDLFNNGPETQNNPQRHAQIITATGGVRGDIRDSVSITSSINAIVNAAINASGYRMQKPPIGASVKVAIAAAAGSCPSITNVPRSRTTGFDFDGVTRTLSFFGGCRPAAANTEAAVSYRYWIDSTSNVNGSPPPCFGDPYYDANEADRCSGRRACNVSLNKCECPGGCGATAPAGRVCNQSLAVCDFVCTPDCGGTCTGYQVCNQTSCSCQCAPNATCAPGFKFDNSAGVCGCVCDTAALNCTAPTHEANPNSCSCVCKPNCGTCANGQSCNMSTCSCAGEIG